MLRMSGEKKVFYGYIVAAAGFAIWLIGWGTYTPCFSVFFKPLLAEFGWSGQNISGLLPFLSGAGRLGDYDGLVDRQASAQDRDDRFSSFLGVSYLLMSQVSALWQFQINYALVGGIGSAPSLVPVMVTVSRWFIKKRR